MAILCNNEVLPFQLYFQDVRGEPYEVKRLWEKQSEIVQYELPTLMENARIGIHFYLDSSKVDVDDVFVRIQTSRYTDVENQEILEIPVNSSKGDLFWIYQGKKDEEFPWRMGIYFLELHFQGRVFKGGINVIPIHLNRNQVDSMHTFLNDQVNGIIYDFVYNAHALKEDTDIELPQYWYYDYARQLSGYYSEFMHSMTKITKQPRQHIKTEYKPSLELGKTDHKNIKWSSSNKGYAKNLGSMQQLYFLNKTKQNQLDTKVNRWLKNILLLWEKDISEVTCAIEKDTDTLRRKLSDMKADYNEYKQKREMLSHRHNVGENMMRDIKSRLLMTEKDIFRTASQYKVLQGWVELLNTFENKIVYFLNHTFLSDIEREYRKPIIKEYHYYKINDMFHQMKQMDKNKGGTYRLTPVLKPTWQVYEYFCLFKVLELLTQFGYSLVSGMDENIINYYFEDRIPEGSQFILEKGDDVIHVWYDHYHANSADGATANGELFYTPFSKKKPDIKVDFFQKKNQTLWHNSTIVFDSKFSKFGNIYNSGYNNSTTEQLAGYYSFFYNGEGNKKGACVDKVICLYAGEDTNDVLSEKPPITYLKLFPPQQEGDEKTTGEMELLQIFKEVF